MEEYVLINREHLRGPTRANIEDSLKYFRVTGFENRQPNQSWHNTRHHDFATHNNTFESSKEDHDEASDASELSRYAIERLSATTAAATFCSDDSRIVHAPSAFSRILASRLGVLLISNRCLDARIVFDNNR